MVYLSIVVVFSSFLASNTSEVSYFLVFVFLKKVDKTLVDICNFGFIVYVHGNNLGELGKVPG